VHRLKFKIKIAFLPIIELTPKLQFCLPKLLIFIKILYFIHRQCYRNVRHGNGHGHTTFNSTMASNGFGALAIALFALSCIAFHWQSNTQMDNHYRTVAEKSVKNEPPDGLIWHWDLTKSIFDRSSAQTPLEKLMTLPRPPYWLGGYPFPFPPSHRQCLNA